MKKVLIIGKRGFVGNSLNEYLKKYFRVKKVSFTDLKKFKNKLNNFDFIINTSINKKYIFNKYNPKFDNDINISKFINNQKTIYCFMSTRKVYPSRANLKENSKLQVKTNYSKNKLITEKKLNKIFKNNLLILRVSNLIGSKKFTRRIHKTFIDFFLENMEKGIILDNGRAFKDFLSIDKFCEIIKAIITKKIVGTYNISIGQKVYLNDLVGWLSEFNNKKFIIKRNFKKGDSFFLNNKKIMSKIKIKNSLEDLKNYCLKFSKNKFS
tara:strand:+ start:3139 stop:3939 length:801 start_codon:yes stop_codon:yes gene_type:complete